MVLSPNDSDVGVVFYDLVERGQVEARQAADLVRAEPAREQPPQPRRRLRAAVETVGPRRRPDVNRKSLKRIIIINIIFISVTRQQ